MKITDFSAFFLSKLSERPWLEQMSLFFDKIFSMCQCGFRKGINSQHCLIAVLEKWRSSKDKANHIKSFVHGHFVCEYHDAGCGDYLIIFK